MPIVFQATEPFAPQLSAAYGAAQQGAQSNADLARLYALQGQMRAEALRGNADRETAANQANYRNIQTALLAAPEAEVARGRLQLARQQHVDASLPSAADEYAARNAMARQQAAFQQQQQMMALEADLQRQELTHREEIDLQRRQAALAEVMNDPALSQQERLVVASQIKTGISPLLVRKQNAEAARAEEQKKIALEATRFQTMLMNGQGAQLADAIKRRIVNIPDGMGGMTQGWVDFEGKLNELPVPRQEKVKPFDEAKGHKDAEEIAARRHPATTVNDQGKVVETAEILQKRAEELPKALAELRAAHAAASGGPAPGQQVQAPPPAPFSFETPTGETQARMAKNYKNDLKYVEGMEADTEAKRFAKEQAKGALTDMKKLLEKYGGVERMPPPAREWFQSLATIVEAAKPRQTPIPPPVPAIGSRPKWKAPADNPFGAMAPGPG